MPRGTHKGTTGQMAVCWCGQEFEKKQPTQKHCCNECGNAKRMEAYHRRLSEQATEVRIGGQDYKLVKK